MAARPPNIIVVFADQLRGSSLGYAGQEPVLTPNLDAFAAQGLRMTRAVSNCPLCCPMRASMITGQHPLRHGVIGNDIQLRPEGPSVARSLASVGYRTAYIGKWHLDGTDRTGFTPPGPRRQGFQHWAACNCNHLYFEAYYYGDEPEPIWIEGYEPTAQTDLAMDWLREASGTNEPFCLWLSYGPPHCPYDHVPTRFLRMYDADALPLRPNVPEADRRIIAGYYAHITALDWNFGRLLWALDDLGLADSTLVIFTSDHGDMLFSQGRGWKSKPWAESVLVPFLARLPGVIRPGTIESAPFGLVDLMPTLCAIGGAPVPEACDGTAWPDMLLGRPGPRPTSTPIYLYLRAVPQSFPEWRGVVTERHTYARFADRAWVLYDDVADPYQLNNLADNPAHADLQQRMETELAAWLKRLDDDFAPAEELVRRFGVAVDSNGVPRIKYQERIAAEQRRRGATRAARMHEA
jgi:arylsulfatase A-like enzyme